MTGWRSERSDCITGSRGWLDGWRRRSRTAFLPGLKKSWNGAPISRPWLSIAGSWPPLNNRYRTCSGFLQHLNIERDGHAIADHRFSGSQHRVPNQAEILAIDLRGGGDSAAGIAPGILDRRCGPIHVKGHFMCDTVNGQVAGQLQLAVCRSNNLLRLK